MFCLCCWPCSTLFPYTTLFRSRVVSGGALDDGVQIAFPAAFAMRRDCFGRLRRRQPLQQGAQPVNVKGGRSEEHTSELQSRGHIVCRLLLGEKKHGL